jgi:hypothetical protein
MAHARPEQLLRLVRVLRDESRSSSVVIHWDRASPSLAFEPFAELGRVSLVDDPVHPEWGGFGVVAAALRTMGTATTQAPFDWFVLLSGQDYPVAPLEEIERELCASGVDAFIDPGRIASGRLAFRWRLHADARLGRRYYFAYRPMPSLPRGLPGRVRGAAHRAAFLADEHQPFVSVWPMPGSIPWRVGRRRLRTPFGPELPCRVGSAWFSLSRRAVGRVLQQAGEDSALARHYRRTIVADESYFQTVLCADPELQVHPDNRRFETWQDTDSPLHPDVLTLARLDEILAAGKHFARKFDDQGGGEVLDRIDEHRRKIAAAARHSGDSVGP